MTWSHLVGRWQFMIFSWRWSLFSALRYAQIEQHLFLVAFLHWWSGWVFRVVNPTFFAVVIYRQCGRYYSGHLLPFIATSSPCHSSKCQYLDCLLRLIDVESCRCLVASRSIRIGRIKLTDLVHHFTNYLNSRGQPLLFTIGNGNILSQGRTFLWGRLAWIARLCSPCLQCCIVLTAWLLLLQRSFTAHFWNWILSLDYSGGKVFIWRHCS